MKFSHETSFDKKHVLIQVDDADTFNFVSTVSRPEAIDRKTTTIHVEGYTIDIDVEKLIRAYGRDAARNKSGQLRKFSGAVKVVSCGRDVQVSRETTPRHTELNRTPAGGAA